MRKGRYVSETITHLYRPFKYEMGFVKNSGFQVGKEGGQYALNKEREPGNPPVSLPKNKPLMEDTLVLPSNQETTAFTPKKSIIPKISLIDRTYKNAAKAAEKLEARTGSKNAKASLNKKLKIPMSPAVHLVARNLPGFFSLTTPSDLLPHFSYTLTPSQLPSIRTHNSNPGLRAALSIQEIPPNALRRKSDPQWRGGFSLGVDLGSSRTGIALSKGFNVRPLMVVELRGEKLELRLLEIAEDEEVDEFIIGIPKSWDGKENPQSNKVRSVAGRFAVRAADRGWRVYLQDEHGTSTEATERMIGMSLSKSTRKKKVDAYAAVMVLERYFSMAGEGTELVLP